MNENDLNRLRDMLDHAHRVMDLVKEETRDALEYDLKLVGALCWSLSIIGEAASKVSPEFRQANAQVPWRSAIATRNFLVHAYSDIDYDIVWTTVAESIPDLINELEKLLPPENEEQ